MTETILELVLNLLKTCSKFIGENGSIRVFDYPPTAPEGFPYVAVSASRFESNVLDTASDTRRYAYAVQIVGEKYGEPGGMSQREAMLSMRNTVDQVLAMIDSNFFLGRQDIVVRTMPSSGQYNYIEGNTRIMMTLDLLVDVRTIITQS